MADFLISSGGCPIAGNLNILPGSENFVREVELLNSKEISSMHIPYSKDNFFSTEEQTREMLGVGVQDPHLDKRCMQPQRPKPTPTPPAPKPQEVNLNIQGAPLISHYEKLVDRLEKEKLQREAEHDRLLKLVDSYAKLVDRLEEQIEALSRERVAANQLGVDPNQCTTLR